MLLVNFILFYVIYYIKFYVCVFPWEKKGRKNWANKPMKKNKVSGSTFTNYWNKSEIFAILVKTLMW